jgi:hypothetical protein
MRSSTGERSAEQLAIWREISEANRLLRQCRREEVAPSIEIASSVWINRIASDV